MTKEQIELLINTAGNEVLDFLADSPKKSYWFLDEDDSISDLWQVFIHGDKDNE